jgi:hypothetical protein
MSKNFGGKGKKEGAGHNQRIPTIVANDPGQHLQPCAADRDRFPTEEGGDRTREPGRTGFPVSLPTRRYLFASLHSYSARPETLLMRLCSILSSFFARPNVPSAICRFRRRWTSFEEIHSPDSSSFAMRRQASSRRACDRTVRGFVSIAGIDGVLRGTFLLLVGVVLTILLSA